MDEDLSRRAEQAMSRALDACGNSRAEFSSDIGPALRELRLVVEALTLDEVRHARENRGNSWTEIAKGLTMTRQGATRKYAGLVP